MIDIAAFNKQLEQGHAAWRAAESSLSKLTPDQMQRMLGWSQPSAPTESTRVTYSLHVANWSPSDPFDSEVDWRNRNGKNYVTPVGAQGGCGTCVAFAVCALVESMALIEKNVRLDLSQSDLAFCGSHSPNCGAWEQTGALGDVKTRGVVSANRYSYLSSFPNANSWGTTPMCVNVPNRNKFSVKVSDFGNIFTISERKSYLTHVGPLVAGLTAYSDLPTYSTGVYSPSSTAKGIGGHELLVIGYSESEQCWLVKNSWGVCWGQGGFGKIAYGACDIDVETSTKKSYFTNCSGVDIPDLVKAELVASQGISTVTTIAGASCCDSFYSDDDQMRHAIVGTSSGQVLEYSFRPGAGHSQTLRATFPDLVDLGGFYTPDDKMRHVISLDARGTVVETYYLSSGGVSETQLATIPGAVKVCGFYSADDRNRHAIVATSKGEIIEIFYGTAGSGKSQVGTVQNIVDICGFYSPDDHYRHVLVGSSDGTITEIYYQPQKGISETVLGKVPNLVKLAGFYTETNDPYSRRALAVSKIPQTSPDCVAAASSGDSGLTEIRYSSPNGAVTTSLMQFWGTVDIGGFYSPDDKYSHGIIALASGAIDELFYGS
jgi:hypothetical protein